MTVLRPHGPPPADPRAATRARRWVREALGLDEGTVVLVRQLACHEPGCPPVETVLAVLHEGGTVARTVHRPVADLTYDDVHTAFTREEYTHDD